MNACEDCVNGKRLYADGYVMKDWSGQFKGDPSTLPMPPDNENYWTYLECSKNAKGLKFINLDGKCNAFQRRK